MVKKSYIGYFELMKNEFSKLFGARVRYFRNMARLSQEQLAEKIGCEATTVSYIENGKNNISFAKLPLLCEALGVEAYQLFLFDRNELPDANRIQELVKVAETMTNTQLGLLYKLVLNVAGLDGSKAKKL